MKVTRTQMLKVLWAVYRAWRRYPHLRFGQLIVNALPVGTEPSPHIFYRKDNLVVQDMHDFYPSHNHVLTRFCWIGDHRSCSGTATFGLKPDMPCGCKCHPRENDE